MGEKHEVELGEVQRTLVIPLAGRARETGRRRPLLRDPKAVEILEAADFDLEHYGKGWGGWLTVLRTAVFDAWVREFLREHPGGTVVEIGTGLNTRFERVDDGRVHWFDLDLPDTIALRRKFFEDTDRRRMIPASFLREEWLREVAESPGPYFFVADGVLVYLPEEELTEALTRIASRFPGARLAFDSYSHTAMDRQHRQAAQRGIPARWAWACDDPRSLEPLGLALLDSATLAALPVPVLAALGPSRRLALRALGPLLRDFFTLSLFRAKDWRAS